VDCSDPLNVDRAHSLAQASVAVALFFVVCSDPVNVNRSHSLVGVLLLVVAVDLGVLRLELGHEAREQLVVALVHSTRRKLHLSPKTTKKGVNTF